jgi:hypothetical protein
MSSLAQLEPLTPACLRSVIQDDVIDFVSVFIQTQSLLTSRDRKQ